MEEFQSTGLIRGPTRLKVHMSWEEVFQSTGLIRGPTELKEQIEIMKQISIHRPHTRPDTRALSHDQHHFLFQSTGLIRGPTLAASFSLRT